MTDTTKREPDAAMAQYAEIQKFRGCVDCAHFYDGGETGDYGQQLSYWPMCLKRSNLGNLRSFPFKKLMPCFELHFWTTPFPDMLLTEEGDWQVNETKAFDAYQDWVDAGENVEDLLRWMDEHPKQEVPHA